MKYTFIHPTKTGGTAFGSYLQKNYSEYFIINGPCHKTCCTNINNPIIVIRDVTDRFISMYKYWKYGAIDTRYKRNKDFLNKYINYDIKKFISLVKNKNTNKQSLYKDYTWDQHFMPQVSWIKDTDYKNIIIIKYTKNLNDKINNIIDSLNIPNKNIALTHINISETKSEKIILDNSDIEFINNYFAEDIKLIEKINNNPELFKLVL